ncbi:MAG TPA: hypothetical protein VG713_06580, partial [Pirellulales bacterium]|nr:hypothetical protein [Pirellulales bacterium]
GDWFRWRETKLPWSQWTERAESLRGQVYQFTGVVRRITVEHPSDEQAARFDLEQYYRCEIDTNGGGPAVVYALKAPAEWKLDQPLEVRGGARAIFVKLAGAAPDAIEPVFVAERIAWYPDTVLGHLGMDVGLFAGVADRTPLSIDDTECFYELLAAVERANTRELMNLTREETVEHPRYPVAPLFNEPEKHHGELLALSGTARRIVEIQVEPGDFTKALGIERYYEIDFFAPQSQGNPITYCVRELPRGVERGENLSVDLRIAGFFFKVWSYRLGEKDGKAQFQLAPMIVGREPTILVVPPADTGFSTIVMVLLVVGMIGVAAGVWWLNRGDRQARRKEATQREPEVRFDNVEQ